MAGSLTWREYTSDHGVKYSIRVDKSNSNLIAAASGETLCKQRNDTWELPPCSLVLRKIHCLAQYNPRIRRTFICGNPDVLLKSGLKIGADYLFAGATTAGDANVAIWLISGYSGESFTNPPYYNQIDTGLDDGSVVNQ